MSSSTLVICPFCNQRLKIKQELVGRKANCPKCAQRIVLEPNTAAVSVDSAPAKTRVLDSKMEQTGNEPAGWKKSDSPQEKLSEGTASNTPKPGSQKVIVGLASFAVVFVLVGGYFGIRLFQNQQPTIPPPATASSLEKTNPGTPAEYAEVKETPGETPADGLEAESKQDRGDSIQRTSLLEFLPSNLNECLLSGQAFDDEEGELTLLVQDSVPTFLEIPVFLPEEYILEFSVRKVSSGGAFALCVPHHGFPVCVVFNGRQGGGIGAIDGQGYGNNITNVPTRQFFNTEPHSIRIVSSPDGLFVDWDGERLTEFTGAPEQLSLETWAHHPNRLFPTLRADHKGHFVIEKATIQTSGPNAAVAGIAPFLQTDVMVAKAEQRFGSAIRDVLALAEKTGGDVQIESDDFDGQRLRFNVRTRNQQVLSVSVAGVDFSPLGEITGPVSFSAPETADWTDAILPGFNPKFRLESLDFHGARGLTPSVLNELPLGNLSSLNLNQTDLSDGLADTFASMKSLKQAHLRGVSIGLETATVLAGLPNLETLEINSNLAEEVSIAMLSASVTIQDLKLITQQQVDQPVEQPIAPDFREFLAANKVPLRDDIIAALQEAQLRASSVPKGHVVIGQVQLPANGSQDDLVCQGVALPGGYFIDAVQTPGIPIWFWHPDCAFAEATPQSSEREIEWLGTVKLQADKRRATVQGIARLHEFEVPDQLKLTAEYAPGFINSIAFEEQKLAAITARLMEIAKPRLELDPQSGEFQISGLLDVPVHFELAGEGSWRFSTVVHPSMQSTTDMGTCDLYSDTGFDPVPNLDSIEPAEQGGPKLKQILDQVQRQVGSNQDGIRFLDRLSKTLADVVKQSEECVEVNGERSAVALVVMINEPQADLSQLRTCLTVREAFYAPGGGDTRSLPRIAFGLAKPGTQVRILLPGYMPFVHQVRGSADAIEVVEAQFKTMRQRDTGGAAGRVTREPGAKGNGFGIQLMANAWPHLGPDGIPGRDARNKEGISVFSGNATKDLDFAKLQPGPYSLRITGANNEWPRDIRFVVEPRRRYQLPKIALYEIPPLKIESLHGFRAYPDRQSLVDAKIEKYTKGFIANQKPVASKSDRLTWGRGTGSWGFFSSPNRSSGALFPEGVSGLGNLGWSIVPCGGNSLAFTPLISPGFTMFSVPLKQWSILRLGTDDISAYQSVEIKYGSSTEPVFPKTPIQQSTPFQLARGYTYLIQHQIAGYAILLTVR